MSLIGFADLDRPVAFASGRIHHAFGGGPFRLEPLRSAVASTADGSVEFALMLERALSERDSRATLALALAPDYAYGEALARVREIDPAATLTPCVLTDWWFRLAANPALRLPPELTVPLPLASNALGSARLMATLAIDSGLVLEAMLRERTALAATVEARLDGVSPRVPVVVRFDSSALLEELLARADGEGAIPRQAMVEYFAGDREALPLTISGTLGVDDTVRFAEAMADRVITRFGRYVPAASPAWGPVVRLESPAVGASIIWALLQPVLAQRQVVIPVDLLSAAQAQVQRLGIDSVVERRTLASLPPLGQTRITALCSLPRFRAGMEALGVTLTFPPHLPFRPQPRTATAVIEPPDDVARMDVMLSPGEPIDYRYTTFVVISDDAGTRELHSPEARGSESTLRLAPEQFPVELALVEVTPELAELAVVSGVCTYDVDGREHRRTFTLDSGQTTVGVAVPRERRAARIEFVALARDGSGTLRLGPFETLQARLDVSSFATYGARQAEVRCVFDDSAALRAVSLLPDGRAETDGNITSLSFTPAESVRTFRWFAPSPFKPGFRYRPFDARGGAWTQAPNEEPLVVYSSGLLKQEAARETLARTGRAVRESLPWRPGRQLESAAAAANETAVEAAATCPQPVPTDDLIYTRIADATKKLYVPRYVLDVQAVSGQQRYRVSMAQGETTSTLTVNLVATAAASLGDAARDAAEYPHALTIQLEFLVAPPAGAVKTLEFTEVSRNGAVVTASLTFATLQERDDVYRALAESERRARLVVKRYIDVSLPQTTVSTPPGRPGFFVLPQRPIAALASNFVFATTATFAAPVVAARAAAAATNPEPVVLSAPAAMTMRTKVARKESAPAMALAASGMLLADVAPTAVLVRRAIDRFVKALPEPTLAFGGLDEEQGQPRLRLAVTNWGDYSDDFFAASPDLPPGGSTKVASRTWVDLIDGETQARLQGMCNIASAKQLAELHFTLPKGKAAPATVRISLTDRRANVVRQSRAVATTVTGPAAPVYLAVRSQLDQEVAPAPFMFPAALHGYIFQGLTPAAGTSQLVRHRFPWRGTFYTYLQDAARPAVVYFFPDRFKVARRREAPFTPFVTVRVSSHSDGVDADVVFDYVVAPYTDPKRLADARRQLLADPRFGASQVQFQPFASSDVRYFIDRPAVAGAVREQRTDAALVLQGALKDTLTMPLGDFRLLFDAMQRRTASMFVGRVEIDVPGGATEVVPFEARLDDLEGELFTYEAAAAQDGSVQVTMVNRAESPLDVHVLDATLTRDGRSVRGLPQGGVLPREGLAPGQSLTLLVAPEAPLAGTSSPEVSFDLSGVTVKADTEAIWSSILNRTSTEYYRLLSVRAVASVFQPVAGREGSKIDTLLVEFEGGATAELDADTLAAQVRVDYPIDDVVLGRPVSATYRYTVTVVRASGVQESDTQPREGSAALFYVSVVR